MDLSRVLDAWPLPGPWSSRSVDAGANNHTWFVTGSAGAFVLRVSRDAADPLRVEAEHDVLRRLARLPLSFSVPAPIPARSGATVVLVEDAASRVATLVPFLHGDMLDPDDPGQISACGAALAELHRALASIEPTLPLVNGRRYGPLDAVDPASPDALALIGDLPVSPATRSRLVEIVEELDRVGADLLGTLPTQIIHADYDASNVLMRQGRVGAILDFEFASVSPPAMDVAIGLWSFAVGSRDRRDPWTAAAAFLRAYRQAGELTPVEATALPALLLIREVTSLRHWGGRLRRGLTTESDLARRADAAVHLAEWLDVHAYRIVATASDAGH